MQHAPERDRFSSTVSANDAEWSELACDLSDAVDVCMRNNAHMLFA